MNRIGNTLFNIETFTFTSILSLQLKFIINKYFDLIKFMINNLYCGRK